MAYLYDPLHPAVAQCRETVEAQRARHTVAQALSSADYSLMEKQRIKTFSRDVFGQLKGLAW